MQVILHLCFGLAAYPAFHFLAFRLLRLEYELAKFRRHVPLVLWLLPWGVGVLWVFAGTVWLIKAVPGLDPEEPMTFAQELAFAYCAVWTLGTIFLMVKGSIAGDKEWERIKALTINPEPES